MFIFFRLHHFHLLRIPANDLVFKITFVAGKAGAGGTKTKYGIFDNRRTCSYAIKEVGKMFKMLIIILRRIISNVS